MNIGGVEVSNPVSVAVKSWKPTPLQASVISIPDTVFERMGGGAAGGGKTDLTVMLPVAREFINHPKYKGLVLRRTFPDLDSEIIPRSKIWYESLGAKYNESKKKWFFPSNAEIHFGHAEREDDVRKYDTAEYNTITWEESTSFTGTQYSYLSFTRCRSSAPDLPAFVSSYTNPGNIGHNYFKERFVDPWPRGGKILEDKKTGMKRIFIPFLGKDNIHLLQNDPTYLARLEMLPEAEKRAKLYGDWLAYSGQVFSEFRALKLQGEPEEALHVIPYFDIPYYWPRIIAIDWGWDAWNAVGWGAISPDGRIYYYRTYKCKKTDIKVWLPDVIRLSESESIVDVTICHSAGQHRESAISIKDQVNAAFLELQDDKPEDEKFQVVLAPKDRIGGKSLLHEALRWRQKPNFTKKVQEPYSQERAAWLLRNKGEDAFKVYCSMYSDYKLEDNLPKLRILETSPEGTDNKDLIDVIPACIPDPDKPEDVKEFPGDDFYDMIRMMLWRAQHYVENSKSEMLRVIEAEKIRTLATSANQTHFYMEMARRDYDKTHNAANNQVRRHRSYGRQSIYR